MSTGFGVGAATASIRGRFSSDENSANPGSMLAAVPEVTWLVDALKFPPLKLKGVATSAFSK
jgi:hypothetical protein